MKALILALAFTGCAHLYSRPGSPVMFETATTVECGNDLDCSSAAYETCKGDWYPISRNGSTMLVLCPPVQS